MRALPGVSHSMVFTNLSTALLLRLQVLCTEGADDA